MSDDPKTPEPLETDGGADTGLEVPSTETHFGKSADPGDVETR